MSRCPACGAEIEGGRAYCANPACGAAAGAVRPAEGPGSPPARRTITIKKEVNLRLNFDFVLVARLAAVAIAALAAVALWFLYSPRQPF